jgi:1,4-alpha-glucan branching enzyme
MTNSTEFKLFAPYNKAAMLIGSFSDWNEIPMQKGDDGYFRVKVELEDGIYQFKFRVQSKSWFLKPDQWVEINDPYMMEMHPETENGIVHIKAGQQVRDTYTWKHDGQALPENHELVMYEMHVADFLAGDIGDYQKFQKITKKLDYLVELGINAIELMPITEYAGDYRWGYLVRYYFAPESSYGTPEDLKYFIDECHARGIRVIMDGIYNHTDDKSPLLYIDRDYWYYHDKHYPNDPANYWGPEFNYDHYDENLDIKPAWKFFGDVVRYWIEEYHIDGIRYDAVRQLANYEFFDWLIQEANQATGGKPFYHIAEHIPDSSEIVKPNGVFDACWHESFRFFLKDALLGELNLEKLKESLNIKQQGYLGVTSAINYLATHDREHLLVELGDRGIFDEAAFQRVKLGVVLQMTAPGIPLVWMGDEFGQATYKATMTDEPNPLDWSLLENKLNHDLFNFYRNAIALRKSQSALQTDDIEFFHEAPDNQVFAFVRWHQVGNQVVVIANFSDQSFENYEIAHFPKDGRWHDWFNDRDVEVTDGNLQIPLPAYTATVLVWQ